MMDGPWIGLVKSLETKIDKSTN